MLHGVIAVSFVTAVPRFREIVRADRYSAHIKRAAVFVEQRVHHFLLFCVVQGFQRNRAKLVKAAAKTDSARSGADESKSASSAPKKAFRDYWVQAGSYSTRERADGVKNSLSIKGISAIVSNQEINGNTFYRVRIGPYTPQNEADYWLAMVKSIDGFQDSQIWESQSFR